MGGGGGDAPRAPLNDASAQMAWPCWRGPTDVLETHISPHEPVGWSGHFAFKIQTCFHNTTLLLKKPAGSPNQILQISGPFPIRTLLAKYCNAWLLLVSFIISPFLPVFHPFSRHIESSLLQKQLCSNWLMISWTPFSYGIFFSLRISIKVFQIHRSQWGFGQEPHWKSRTSSKSKSWARRHWDSYWDSQWGFFCHWESQWETQ